MVQDGSRFLAQGVLDGAGICLQRVLDGVPILAYKTELIIL